MAHTPIKAAGALFPLARKRCFRNHRSGESRLILTAAGAVVVAAATAVVVTGATNAVVVTGATNAVVVTAPTAIVLMGSLQRHYI